ncbi:MAG: hypothetical protein AB7S75_19935 [Desulfococcaceae bacterium]
MNFMRMIVSAVMAMVLTAIEVPRLASALDTTPPSSPVRLVFIHHSTGGNWLADPNDGSYGGLGIALRDNNYYVSATNYGWGPDSIGDRTDIPNWPEWFTGTNRDSILNTLYNETAQNVQEYGSWSRLSTAPAGENQIILFKSCFPNSNLYGDPNDSPLPSPDEQYTVDNNTVANAKAVYNNLLTYFSTRQDKLFVVITAPPLMEIAYSPDYQTPAQRAANARAFNNWLVNDWLDGYPHNNVAVFDYFNILTHTDNHHHIIVSGNNVHYTSPLSGDFAYYPSGDSHPNTTGHQKATAEFVPLLNAFYNTWKGTGPVIAKPTVTTGSATAVSSSSATLNGTVNPNGAATNYYFEYDLTTAYETSTPIASAGSGTVSVSVNANISGLSAGMIYHFRLAATNSEGTTLGNNQTFSALSATVVFGNIDGSADGKITLADAILALRICAGISVSGAVLAAEVSGDLRIGLAEAVYALREVAGLHTVSQLVQPSDFQYLGAFRLPEQGERPLTFAYGGNAMSFNPDGDPTNSDAHPGSLFVTGHDRLPYGDLPDGDQIAEVSIPVPAITANPADLPEATFIQTFHNALQGQFTDMEEIPKVGMQYLNHTDTGPKIHVCWGQHLQPENAASHGWINANLDTPSFQGTWFIGNQNLYSVNGYMFDIPAPWADTHLGGRYLATGRMRDGGQGGMGPALFAYRPWLSGGAAPASGTHLEEKVLLLYENADSTEEIIRCMQGYQHADEWEGGAWITTASGKSALLFAGNKATGTKYWYGFRNPNGADLPCVDTHIIDFTTCRNADGSPCPAQDFAGCCEAGVNCISDRGWWSTRFDAQLILFDPADLAQVAAGTMDSWQPQPYAAIDIDEHLYFNPSGTDLVMIGEGVQRRYRIGAVAYDRNSGLLYVLELFVDEGKPVVHVWKIL